VPKGTLLLEYLGERISHASGRALLRGGGARRLRAALHRRPQGRDRRRRRRRAARYVNHSCDPNCEADEIGGRIFITSIRDIRGGEELTYDYNMEAPSPLPRDWRRRYACRCGTPRCRGTIVVRPRRARDRARREGARTKTRRARDDRSDSNGSTPWRKRSWSATAR
jgi:SET domain-containing protein